MRKIISITLLLLTLNVAMAQAPVYDLVERISSGAGKYFLFELDDQESENDFFEIDQKGAKIWIKGNNNISIATGLNWYLKYHAGVQITWNNPRPYLGDLPRVKASERHSTDMLTRYYLNYETFSYSMPFWDWKRWQQEIDFMALHGINTPLSLTGASTVWRNTLLKLGYTKEQANKFIGDPTHQAWSLRGQMMSGETPNDDLYYDNQQMLEQQIVERYLEWGIEPVFAGFSGMIPCDAHEKLGVKTLPLAQWNANDRPSLIDPADPRFAEIAAVYYDELKALYGETKYYAIDPSYTSELDLVGASIYGAMRSANPVAVWVVQAWQQSPAREMLEVVPPSGLLVLDAWSESRPQWGDLQSENHRADGFSGHDWVYCMKQNFNGNTGMSGKMQRVIDGYYVARTSEQGRLMRGVGVTADAIENNPVMFELLYELPWRAERFTKESWLATWTKARYGRTTPEIDEAWAILSNTAYNIPHISTQEGATQPVICSRPALLVDRVAAKGTTNLYYKADEFEKAFSLMLKSAAKFSYSDNFKYDLVDIASQVIANRANELLPQILIAFERGRVPALYKQMDAFLDLILLQDRLMGSRSQSMVGGWIEQAMRNGRTGEQHDQYRTLARELLTTWGSRDASVKGQMRDISYREWNGLLSDFYYPRWKYFFDQIKTTKMIPQGINYYDIERMWVVDKTPYEHRPTADAIAMANEVYLFLSEKQ